MSTWPQIANPCVQKEWQSCINHHLWQLEEYRLLISALRYRRMSMPRFKLSIHEYLSHEVPSFLSQAQQFCPDYCLSPLEEKLKAVQQEVYPLCLERVSD